MTSAVNHTIFLGTGTNIGDRHKNLEHANRFIEDRIGPIHKQSSIYVTAAWGLEDQADFLNQVLIVQTHLPPVVALEEVLNIEKDMGRQRIQKWGSRIIDIDILYYDDQIINLPSLIVPHPYLSQRNFVLFPLAEIAPNHIHPISKKSNQELLDLSTDPLLCERLIH